MNAVSGTILIVLALVVALAPRRWALLAILAGVFFLTRSHSIDVAGLNLYPIRILAVVACTRVLVRRELVWSRLNRIDWTLLVLYNYTALVWTLRSSVFAAQQVAFGVDYTLWYLALRALIGSLDDVRWLLNAFVSLLVPFTALVLLERVTGQSSFTVVGGNSAFILERNGVPRCLGTFHHAVLLGSVAASFLAVYTGVWAAGPRSTVGFLGALLSAGLVVLSNSGGPLTSAAAALIGWSLWPLRERMRLVRRASMALAILLMVVMKAPIWYLPFKISQVVGGGGFHRGHLMDQAWQDLGKWWLFGMDITGTASWFPYIMFFGGADITNQFVAIGIKAGLLAVVLTVVVLSLAFRAVGRASAALRVTGESRRGDLLLLWGLGVAIFVHAVSWLGVAYFDQSYVVWLLHVAAISASTQAFESPVGDTRVGVTVRRTRWSRRAPPAPGRRRPLRAIRRPGSTLPRSTVGALQPPPPK